MTEAEITHFTALIEKMRESKSEIGMQGLIAILLVKVIAELQELKKGTAQ